MAQEECKITLADIVKRSINKWQKNVEIVNRNRMALNYHVLSQEGFKASSDACPLCQLFKSGGCDGCPIALDSGSMCLNTPFWDAYYKFVSLPSARYIDDNGLLKACKDMLEYLIVIYKKVLKDQVDCAK